MTQAIRSFLHAGGRILISPTGQIEEAGGRLAGSDADWHGFLTAGRALWVARTTYDADEHVARAVRILGSKHPSGWRSLSAGAPYQENQA
ncbi:hypothetical protein [Sphingomonas sp. BK069]|uniref:hypothetical protein n=1 Tax=Sphingomonas sp. BK069 TaxID=2586979 RepID=UPI0016193F61|nr:hypothetical protein [Sphingomonas sp. BK069]MBB3347342.1 hypothetical protein [Sphingomonas sp. BK069]